MGVRPPASIPRGMRGGGALFASLGSKSLPEPSGVAVPAARVQRHALKASVAPVRAFLALQRLTYFPPGPNAATSPPKASRASAALELARAG